MLAENLSLQIQSLPLEFQFISLTDTDFGLKTINSEIISATTIWFIATLGPPFPPEEGRIDCEPEAKITHKP